MPRLDAGALPPLRVARVLEQHCIGCTLCIQACPVDAIVGANKVMHTVLADHCTGCELCTAPCPVDCIVMEPVQPARGWTQTDAELAWQRHQAHEARTARHPETRSAAITTAEPDDAEQRKRAILDAALLRARARRAGH